MVNIAPRSPKWEQAGQNINVGNISEGKNPDKLQKLGDGKEVPGRVRLCIT